MEKFLKHAIPVFMLLMAYLVFSFIAWDLNPAHWLLFTTVVGRCWAVIIVGAYISAVLQHYDEY